MTASDPPIFASSCPTAEELQAFAAGRVDSERTDGVAGHIEQCTTCQAKLEALDAKPPQVTGVPEARDTSGGSSKTVAPPPSKAAQRPRRTRNLIGIALAVAIDVDGDSLLPPHHRCLRPPDSVVVAQRPADIDRRAER